jgi:hypothetical protein
MAMGTSRNGITASFVFMQIFCMDLFSYTLYLSIADCDIYVALGLSLGHRDYWLW